MSVLIDTNVIVSYLVKSDKNHDRAFNLFQSLVEKSFGTWYITDFVLDEVLTVLWSDLKRKEIVQNSYQFITNTEGPFNILFTTGVEINDIWEKWNKFAEYPKRPLSFTDASLLAIAEEYGIEHIGTFDAEFNGLISVLQS